VEKKEPGGSSEPKAPVYVEVVRVYQPEYVEAVRTPGVQQQQGQTQAQQLRVETSLATTSSSITSPLLTQESSITSDLVKKMRERFGVEPAYSVWYSAESKTINVPATLERYKNALKQAVTEAYLIASLALARLVRQHEEFVKKTKRVSALYMQSYNKRKEELEKDIEALATLYAEIDSLQVPEKGDEKVLAQLEAKLSELADKAHSYYSKYKDAKISVDTLAKTLIELSERKEEPWIKENNQALQLMADRDRLKDLLARFFVLMDFARTDTYNQYMSVYEDHISSLLKIIRDEATYADFLKALPFAYVLLEMEAKGWLDYKKQFGKIPERAWEYHADPTAKLRELDWKYQKKLNAIENGKIPQRETAPTVAFAEFIGAIDPYKRLGEYVYSSLEKVVGSQVAGAIASATTGAVAGAVAAASTPLAVILGAIALADTVSDIGTRLENPVDREVFAKILEERWQEILIDAAIAVAAAAVTGYAVGKVKPIVSQKIKATIQRINPGFADKLFPAKAIKGEPVYKSNTTIVTVNPEEGKIHIYTLSKGEVKNAQIIKIPKNLKQYYDDPQLKLSIDMLIGKLDKDQIAPFLSLLDDVAEKLGADGLRDMVRTFMNKLEAGGLKSGVNIFYIGESGIAVDNEGIVIFNPSTKKLITISPQQGKEFYPLLQAARQDPVAFNIYYLAKVYNIKPEVLMEKLSPFLDAISKGYEPVGDVVVGSLKFSFRGDKLNIFLPDIGKPVQLDIKGFSPNSLLTLVLNGEKFASTYGGAMHGLLLDSMAFGYRLVSIQAPDVLINLGGNVAPVLSPSKILPKPLLTRGAMMVTRNGSIYVSDQLLEYGIDISTVSTVKVAKSLLHTKFTQQSVTVIELPVKALKYLQEAVKNGFEGENAILYAMNAAKATGDATALLQLAKVQMATLLAKESLAHIPLIFTGSDGGVVGVVGSSAVTSAIDTSVHLLQQGSASQAQDVLTQALVKTGLSEGTAKQVAQSIIQTMTQALAEQRGGTATRGSQAAIQIPQTEPPKREASARQVAIPRPPLAPINNEKAVPAVSTPMEIYIPVEEETSERATARATVVPAVLTLPLILQYVVELEEEQEEAVPPLPTPKAMSLSQMPFIAPGGSPSPQGTPTPSKPLGRGRRQLEELEI
jgi:hypothetical protein